MQLQLDVPKRDPPLHASGAVPIDACADAAKLRETRPPPAIPRSRYYIALRLVFKIALKLCVGKPELDGFVRRVAPAFRKSFSSPPPAVDWSHRCCMRQHGKSSLPPGGWRGQYFGTRRSDVPYSQIRPYTRMSRPRPSRLAGLSCSARVPLIETCGPPHTTRVRMMSSCRHHRQCAGLQRAVICTLESNDSSQQRVLLSLLALRSRIPQLRRG